MTLSKGDACINHWHLVLKIVYVYYILFVFNISNCLFQLEFQNENLILTEFIVTLQLETQYWMKYVSDINSIK